MEEARCDVCGRGVYIISRKHMSGWCHYCKETSTVSIVEAVE